MNVQHQKNLFKKLVGLAGIASASVLLSLPGLAQAAPNAGGMNQPINSDRQSDATVTDGQLLAQTMSNQGNGSCAGYEGNATTGGGYYCTLSRMNSGYGTTQPQGSSDTDNAGSTTGAGYPGNNVRPQGVDHEMNRESYNPGSNSRYEKATDNTYKRTGDFGFYNDLTGEHFAPDENVISP